MSSTITAQAQPKAKAPKKSLQERQAAFQERKAKAGNRAAYREAVYAGADHARFIFTEDPRRSGDEGALLLGKLLTAQAKAATQAERASAKWSRVAESVGPQAKLSKEEKKVKLQEALASLTPEQRLALKLAGVK